MTAPTIRGYWDGQQLIPVTLRGYWDGTSLQSVTLRDLTLNTNSPTPTPPPPVTKVMKLGSSAVPSGSSWTNAVAHQRSVLHMNTAYWYDSANNQRWSDVAAIDPTTDLWFQWRGTTYAEAAAMIAGFPATRKGLVFLHYQQEPEDNIANTKNPVANPLTIAQWQARTDALYQAIADSGKPYIMPSVELQYYTLQQTNKGQHGVNDSRWLPNYLRPGVRWIGWSAYAETKLSNGHWIAGTSPDTMPKTIGAWMNKAQVNGGGAGLGVSIISGWPLKSGYETDTVTLQNRSNWTNTVVPNLQAQGIAHYLWFDVNYSNGDYMIEHDAAYLEPTWLNLAAAAGQ